MNDSAILRDVRRAIEVDEIELMPTDDMASSCMPHSIGADEKAEW